MNCAGPCERVLLPYGFVGPLPLGHARAHVKDKCGACYQLERRRGAERRTYPRAELIAEVALLANGERRGEVIAARLGVTWDTLRSAHRRAGVPVPVVRNPETEKYNPRKAA